MHISNRYRTVSAALGLVILTSMFGGQVYAQYDYNQNPPTMPNQNTTMPSQNTPTMPAQITGKYSNSVYGVDITLPDGWSGMELKSSTSTAITAMPGGMSSSQMPPAMMFVTMVEKSSTTAPPTKPQNLPQGEKCDDPAISSKTVSGLSLTEYVIECSGTTSMKIKTDVAQTSQYYVSASFVAMPASNYDSNVGTFDTAVGTMHVANAIEAPSNANSTPAVPEFPIAIVGLVMVLMMGVAIVMTRRLQIRV